jgi:UDP-GlcNAc:undecaprenyl-phosphate GlcNAc-1-phosphate transferase
MAHQEEGSFRGMLANQIILQLLFTTALAAVVTALLMPVGRKARLVDHPEARKVHTEKTPLTGGLAVLISVSLVVYLALPLTPFIEALAISSLLLMVVSIIDDYRHMRPAARFLAQIIACLLMVHWGGMMLTDFGRLFSNSVFGLGWLAMPITIFSAIGVINAFNMIDGMDGLAGSIFIITAGGMAFLAAGAGHAEMASLLLIAVAAVFGFLLLNARFPWNSRARVFLGDSGSIVLGLLLAWVLIAEGNGDDRAFAPITAVWLISVPLLDTSCLIWKRRREGRSAFTADQYHLHHAFLRAGFSVGQTWAGIIALALACALIGIAMEYLGVPEYLRFYLFMAFAFYYYFYLKHSWLHQRFLGRDFIYQDFIVEEPQGSIR